MENNLGPRTRGVPAKETLWLDDVRKRRDEWKYHKKVRLSIDEIMHLVFPQDYQKKYYEIATKFYKCLLKKQTMWGFQTGLFLKQNNIAKSTFYNKILPRLKRVGMITSHKEHFNHEKNKQRYYRNYIKPSKQFSIFFMRIIEEYDSILDTAEKEYKLEEKQILNRTNISHNNIE